MNPLRLVSTPTRNRRLNEILGLVVLVAAGLLFLALATYTPTDPSADTVGGLVASARVGLGARLGADLAGPAHNWTGLIGAWLADAILQTIGIAAFFLPIVLGRLGLCWMRQRPAGSAKARFLGLGLWVLFAPAAIGLLPHTFLWRHALPIEGVTGRLLADFMVHYLNLPGATIVLALMVAMSLYLATTFTFNTASEWASTHLSWIHRIVERFREWRARRAMARGAGRDFKGDLDPNDTAFEPARATFSGSRENNLAQAALELEKQREAEAAAPTTLLGSLFGWWARLRRKEIAPVVSPDAGATEAEAGAPVS